MQTKDKFFGFLALLGTAFIGGAIGVYAVKVARENLEPLAIIFFRFLLASLLFLLIYSKTLLSEMKKLDVKNILKVFFISLLWFFNVYLFAWGIKYTTGIASQLTYTLTPVFVLIIGAFFLKETITLRQMIGMVIAFIGVIFVVIKSKSTTIDILHSLGTFRGNIIILGAVTCWSSYLVFSRKMRHQFSGRMLTFFSLITCFALSLPLVILENKSFNLWLLPIDVKTGIAIIILAVFPSIIMLSLHQYALKRLKAFYAGYSAFLAPFFASLVGVSFFGEKITTFLAIGFVLIFVGSFLVASSQLKTLKDGLMQSENL